MAHSIPNFSRLFVGISQQSVELFRVRLVASLYVAIYLWASGRDVPMRNAEIRKMPSELWSERRVVVCLNFLNEGGKMLTNFPKEVDGRLGVIVAVDAQNAKACSFINRRKLIKALASSSNTRNELHIELDGAPRNLEGSVRGFRARAIFLQRNATNSMAAKYFKDGCWRDVRMIVPLKIQACSDGAIAALFANAEDQRNNLGWDAIPDVVRSAGLISKTG
jgi:hypothetical protein